MSVKLDQNVWLYVERLFVHCYDADTFILFLKKFGIEYKNDVYRTLAGSGPPRQDPMYIFMSEPNYDFSNFMQTIPSYKYLPILVPH